MSDISPAAVIYDQDGYQVSVKDNALLTANEPIAGNISGIVIAGSDGYRTHFIHTDGYGNLAIGGQHPDGYSPAVASPFLIAGKDDTDTVRTVKTLPNGVLENRYYELATFNAAASNIDVGQNKSLMSIVNGSSKIVRIEEIYLVNVRATKVTAVAGVFELHRITSHSGGTDITNVESYDLDDTLDSLITVKTNSIVSGESTNFLWKNKFSTNEYDVRELSTETTEHIFQTMFPIFVKKTNNTKTITLKAGQGLSLKFITNSNAGSFDVFFVLTQE